MHRRSIHYSLITLLFFLIALMTIALGIKLPSKILLLLIAAIICLPVVVFLLLHQPYYLALFFVLFSFFRIHEAFPVLLSLRIPQILAMLVLITIPLHLLLKNIELYMATELKWYCFFFSLITVGLFFSTNFHESFSDWSGVFFKIFCIVFCICWLMNQEYHFKHTQWLVMLTGSLIAILTLYNKVNGIGLVEGTRVTIGRDIGSLLGDPNDLSLVLLFPLSFTVSCMLNYQENIVKILSAIISMIIFSAIIATQSRGGLLGTLAILGFFINHRIKNKPLLAFIIGIGSIILYLMAGISGRASGGTHEAGIDESAMGRLYAWVAAFRMGITNPLTGVGIGNFYYNYYLYSDFWDGKNHAVHSTWFQILAEAGLLGLIVFLILIFLTIKNTRKLLLINGLKQQQPKIYAFIEGIYIGMIGFCVSGTFLTQGFIWPFYVFMSFVIAMTHFLEKQQDAKSIK